MLKKMHTIKEHIQGYEKEHPLMVLVWPFLVALVVACIIFAVVQYGHVRKYSGDVKVEFASVELEKEMQELFGKNVIYEQDLKNLKKLEIIGNDNLDDISDLEKCENLVELSIIQCDISDIGVLGKMEKLKVVKLDGNNIKNLAGIEKVDTLEELSLSTNKISSLGEITQLKNLKKLTVANNNLSVLDEEILYLKNLKYLNVSQNRLVNIDVLRDLEYLEELYVNENMLSETPNLDGMKQLEILGLAKNAFVELNSMGQLEGLMELDVSTNYLSSLSFLEGVPNLVKLNISYNQFKELQGITVCPKLQYLALYGTSIENVEVLQKLESFNTIYVDDDFDRTQLDFMIGNFRNGDLLTKEYLLNKQYDLK